MPTLRSTYALLAVGTGTCVDPQLKLILSTNLTPSSAH